MDTRNLNLLEKLLYNPVTTLNPVKPLIIWGDANYQLNKKYKSPDVNLTDSVEDLKIKNTARHITGLGLAASQYGYLAYPIGAIKEGTDLAKDLFKPPYGRVSQDVVDDTILDFQNNHKGIQFMLKNPNATSDDLMNYAIELARQNQTPKLYGYITNTEESENEFYNDLTK